MCAWSGLYFFHFPKVFISLCHLDVQQNQPSIIKKKKKKLSPWNILWQILTGNCCIEMWSLHRTHKLIKYMNSITLDLHKWTSLLDTFSFPFFNSSCYFFWFFFVCFFVFFFPPLFYWKTIIVQQYKKQFQGSVIQ